MILLYLAEVGELAETADAIEGFFVFVCVSCLFSLAESSEGAGPADGVKPSLVRDAVGVVRGTFVECCEP